MITLLKLLLLLAFSLILSSIIGLLITIVLLAVVEKDELFKR